MPVTPVQPDSPGSDPGPFPGFRDDVRTLVRDGMPSTNTTPYGLVRLEALTDQIALGGGTTQFYVRFSTAPGGRNVTYFPVAATINAYRDNLTTPDTIANGKVTSDIDQNGNFTLQTAPSSSLLVTYGYQLLLDADIDQFLDLARSWLFAYSVLDNVPDGLNHALVQYACYLACSGIARQFTLPNVKAGEATEDLSQIAAQWGKDALTFLKQAEASRDAYWTSGGQPKRPAAARLGVRYPQYQPGR